MADEDAPTHAVDPATTGTTPGPAALPRPAGADPAGADPAGSDGDESLTGIEDPSPLSVEEVLHRLSTARSGLGADEAARRLAVAGPNTITSRGHSRPLVTWLAQFRDWLVLLLLVCAGVVGWLGDLSTAGVLVFLVLVNTTIGFVQEYRAERTMEALRTLVHPTTQVVRNGGPAVVDSSSLVPGDLARLSGGDSVPADLRLVSTQSLEADEFALTGESDPTRKSTTALEHPGPLQDRHDMVFAGTVIGAGEATGVVTATGMRTQLGHIAHLSDTAPSTPSPVQREMARIARIVGVAVVVLSLALLVWAVQAQMPLRQAVLFAVGLACALVPQGLPAEVSTSLAQASAALARKHALVKKLSAVETLGATRVICTDKTGTLTRNEMTVVQVMVGGDHWTSPARGTRPEGASSTTPPAPPSSPMPGPRSSCARASSPPPPACCPPTAPTGTGTSSGTRPKGLSSPLRRREVWMPGTRMPASRWCANSPSTPPASG